MANVILTNQVLVVEGEDPPPAPEESPMAEAPSFPRWYFAADGRQQIFETPEVYEAAGGPSTWYRTPADAAAAAARAAAPQEEEPEEDAPAVEPEEDAPRAPRRRH